MNPRCLFLVFFAALALTFSACSDSQPTNSCTQDNECGLGTVCSAQNTCIQAACEFCTADQICYKPTPESAGTCSAPECLSDADCDGASCRNGLCGAGGCTTNDDCGDGEVCTLAGACEASDGTCSGDADCPSGEVCKEDSCVPGCSKSEDCPDGQFCNAESTCADGCRGDSECPSSQVCTDGNCACTAASCPDGKVCLDTGNCGDPTDCSQVVCPMGEVCDATAGFTCIVACTADSCDAGQACNAQTGKCEVSNCPAEDPTQCDNNAQRPIWDPIRCFCAECTADTDCDVAGGETCNASGTCFSCQTTCDSGVQGTCDAAAGSPYCIDSCCVQCIGAADCQNGEICNGGQCGPPPNCAADPTVCPAGYTCNAGTCTPPNNNACDPMDPASCAAGQSCDPISMTCQGLGGGFGCGLCNADCTCDNGLNCDTGFLCGGCDDSIEAQLLCAAVGGDGCCPGGEICLGGLCLIDLGL